LLVLESIQWNANQVAWRWCCWPEFRVTSDKTNQTKQQGNEICRCEWSHTWIRKHRRHCVS
jgi:hypothetical protein